VANQAVRGTVLYSEVIKVSGDRWRKLCRLADGARLCLDRHSERMEFDSDYREAVEHLTKLMSARPGRLGETVRIMAAGHSVLVKVLSDGRPWEVSGDRQAPLPRQERESRGAAQRAHCSPPGGARRYRDPPW
jgi:hypothetical protein